jgi:rhodanese-related sulfurtransferase
MSDSDIKRVTPPVAAQVLAESGSAILVDVRSKVEYDYVGHPTGAVSVIWKDYPAWQENPDFVAEVKAALVASGSDDVKRPILAICRSGVRSLAAAQALAGAGYANLYNVEEGFEGDKDAAGHRGLVGGWKFHGLPWEQG